MKEKIVLLFLVALFAAKRLSAQTYANSKQVFEAAEKLKKPILLIFSGSDWCMPCIRLKKKVLDDSSFKAYCQEKLLLYTADFPQKKKLNAEQTKDNELLASQFNPKGEFPQVVLIKPDRTVLSTIEASGATTENWIKTIDALLSKP